MDSGSQEGRGKSKEQNYRPYDFQSRQPCMRVAVELPLGSLRDTDRIDSWLLGPFAIPADRLPASSGPRPDNGRDALAAAVVERALVLFGDLCRASGIPCFETGRVLKVRPIPHRPQDREAIVLVPVIDNVPAVGFGNLLKDILKLFLTTFTNEPELPLAEKVLDAIKRGIVDRFANALNFNSSSLPICRLAFERGIPFRHIGHGFFIFGSGAKSTITRGAATTRDSALGARICMHKQITAGILRTAGLPAAEHRVVGSYQAAHAAARELGWPVVVKPSDQERSQGVTTGVASEAALTAAYDLARAGGGATLVERQAAGICHRIMVAAGQLVYAVIRYPKGVTGNGRETVAQLAASANAAWARMPPWKRLKDVPLDEEAIRCLANQGLAPDSVPAAGRRVFVRAINSGEWGGDIENLTADVHPENVELAVTAARLLGLTVAGIDLMTTDIARPWHENGATIIEVNFDPQFATSRREEDAGRLLSALVEGDGRIPVHLVTGEGDLLKHARSLRSELSRNGRAIHITSGGYTEDHLGREIAMKPSTLFERSLALAMRTDVHELILTGEKSELLEHGLAVDCLESAYVVIDDPRRREQLAGELRARFRIGDCR